VPAVVFDRVTAGGRGTAPCYGVSLAIPAGSVYALIGREGAGKATIVRCLMGELRPKEGRVVVLGLDARRQRRALKKRILRVRPGEEIRAPAVAPELVVLERRSEPAPGGAPTVFVTTTDPALAAAADRVGFLKDGRLVLDESVTVLLSRFRRIRYVSEMTETRTDYGMELDLFDAVRVRVRGWGVDAVVSNFDEAAFERFLGTDGVKDPLASPMSLEEIFAAVVG